MIQFNCRRLAAFFQFAVLLSFLAPRAFAAEKTLNISGMPVTLQDLSADVTINYYSMRLNRALNVWNVEVAISNKSSVAISGPVALYIESFSGTTGPLQSDGTDGVNAFYDLSGFMLDG